MEKEKEEQRVLIFAGTTEGRMLAEYAASLGICCYVSTATSYGEKILDRIEGIHVISGRMNEKQMKEFIRKEQISLVIDATHPFAAEVTENITQACVHSQTKYVRCLREQRGADAKVHGKMIEVNSVKDAVEYLKCTKGNIFIATGSRELQLYTDIADYKERCFARVLSTRESVELAVGLGFEGRHLVAMQGPFSCEMNLAQLRAVGAAYFVTKESGKAGGFEEKVRAASEAGAELVVIGRPEEKGESLESVMEILRTCRKGSETEAL